MDNKKYEALLLISETGSITKAAETMGYTQSGITQMVNSLEKELGIKLLSRTNRGANLTSAGKQLLPFMREEQRWENHIKQECARMNGLETGVVTVGCLSSISSAWLPQILQIFSEKHPTIRVNLREAEAPMLEKMLASGRIDVAITELNNNKAFKEQVLVWDEILAVLPPEHDLASEKSVSLSQLAQYPLISYDTGEDSPDAQGWPEAITEGKYKFNTMYTCRNDFTALEMVSYRLGVSLAGALMLRNYQTDTVNISLNPPKYRCLGLATRMVDDMLPATQSFVKCVKEVILERMPKDRTISPSQK